MATRGRLAVWVAYRDGRAGEGRTNLAAPSDRFDVLLDAARPCLRRAWIPRAAATRMHLIAERLAPRGDSQLGLFDPPDARVEEVARLKRQVNGRHGRFVLRSAATLPLGEVYRDSSNAFDICDDCGVSPGQIHAHDCDVEQCPGEVVIFAAGVQCLPLRRRRGQQQVRVFERLDEEVEEMDEHRIPNSSPPATPWGSYRPPAEEIPFICPRRPPAGLAMPPPCVMAHQVISETWRVALTTLRNPSRGRAPGIARRIAVNSEYDEEDEQEALRLQELYLQRVRELNLQLAPWQGGSAVTASYSFEPTNSIFSSASTPVNSVLEVHLQKAGLEEVARLRCIASWRVTFLCFWINVNIKLVFDSTE